MYGFVTLGITRDPNVRNGTWKFSRVVEAYPDEMETTKDVRIVITPLDKLIEFGEGGKDSNVIKMDASYSVIIGLEETTDNNSDRGHGRECKIG